MIKRKTFTILLIAILAGAAIPSYARCYDAHTGRFYTMDPFEGDIKDPTTLHSYNYCANDPINLIDPSGYDPELASVLTSMDVSMILAQASSPASSKAVTTVKAPLRALPMTQDKRLIAAAVFAESKAGKKGEDPVEKLGIAATLINEAFYAKLPPGSKQKRNYNAPAFGDGTILGALRTAFKASYQKNRWNLIATASDLKPLPNLDRDLQLGDRDHYNFSVDAANATVAPPMSIKDFNNEAPVQFNQADDRPPNPNRQHKIGHAGAHTFYGFDKGHEYQ